VCVSVCVCVCVLVHFGTQYCKTPLPADKKGPVREVQQAIPEGENIVPH
jgi:hypothetical protein